jgi:hypothetical protein
VHHSGVIALSAIEGDTFRYPVLSFDRGHALQVRRAVCSIVTLVDKDVVDG